MRRMRRWQRGAAHREAPRARDSSREAREVAGQGLGLRRSGRRCRAPPFRGIVALALGSARGVAAPPIVDVGQRDDDAADERQAVERAPVVPPLHVVRPAADHDYERTRTRHRALGRAAQLATRCRCRAAAVRRCSGGCRLVLALASIHTAQRPLGRPETAAALCDAAWRLCCREPEFPCGAASEGLRSNPGARVGGCRPRDDGGFTALGRTRWHASLRWVCHRIGSRRQHLVGAHARQVPPARRTTTLAGREHTTRLASQRHCRYRLT